MDFDGALELERAWHEGLTPDPLLSVSKWSDRHRVLSTSAGSSCPAPAKWIPQGWQWVDPEKEFKALLVAMRAGLISRSEAISAFGYDAEDVDREIAADNRRADGLGLAFDSDPRRGAAATAVTGSQAPGGDDATSPTQRFRSR